MEYEIIVHHNSGASFNYSTVSSKDRALEDITGIGNKGMYFDLRGLPAYKTEEWRQQAYRFLEAIGIADPQKSEALVFIPLSQIGFITANPIPDKS